MKKNNNISLETELRKIRQYYQARVNNTICKMNFNSKRELKECGIIGQRIVRDFKSISDDELNIIVKDFRMFLIQFSTELRNTFRNIYFRRKQNKKWKKEKFILYMLEITNINHNLPETLLHLEEKTFSQFHFDMFASLIESFILKWWCPEDPELQKLIYHPGRHDDLENSFFYANRMYDLITEIKTNSN